MADGEGKGESSATAAAMGMAAKLVPSLPFGEAARREGKEGDELPMGKVDSLIGKARLVRQETAKAWESCKPYMDKLQPFVDQLKPLLRQLLELCKALQRLNAKLRPYYPHESLEIAFASVMLLMGGQFALTIACVQAFRMSAGHLVAKDWQQLKKSFQAAMAALKKDKDAQRLFGADTEKALDIQKISGVFRDIIMAESEEEKKLSRERAFVVMKCVDPNKLLDALRGLWLGVMAVVSTLRSRFAYCVSLGATLGSSLFTTLHQALDAKLAEMFPDQKKWVEFAMRVTCTLFGIGLSLALVRLVSAFSSAVQGATLLTKLGFHHWKHRGVKITPRTRQSLRKYVFTASMSTDNLVAVEPMEFKQAAVMWTLATLGLLFQVITRFDAHWLLKLPLAPVYLVESSLSAFSVI